MTSTSAVNGNHSLFEDIVHDEVSPNVAKSCKRTSAIFNSSDSSDSDDDMYSNYLNKYTKKSNVENKSRNFITVADMHEEMLIIKLILLLSLLLLLLIFEVSCTFTRYTLLIFVMRSIFIRLELLFTEIAICILDKISSITIFCLYQSVLFF
uniref:CPXV159 protein n=1 Tax=Heterorhabditis bacteriophora TaxID=37862 RepID=A0A1I7WAY0_HETBA